MAKSNNTMLWVGGAIVVGFIAYEYLMPSTATSAAATASSTNPPAVPDLTGATVNNYSTPGYYDNVLYPAMLKADPNIGNPSYTLTNAEVNQILANYADLRQGLQQRVNSSNDIYAVVRDWWHTNGVPEKRTFLPLNPPSAVPYTGPTATPKSSGSSGWLSALGIVAQAAVAIAGTNNEPVLSDYDVQVLITGAAIAMDILPFYYKQNNGLALQATDRIEALVEQYC